MSSVQEAFDEWFGQDGVHISNPIKYQTFKAGYWRGKEAASDQLRAAQVAILRKAADRLYAGGEADNTWNILRRMADELEKS